MRRIAPIAFIVLAGCITVEAPDAPPDEPAGGGACRAGAASTLVGQTANSETGARALSLTGARALRWGPPNSAWTMDYREDRVNVRYDEAMRITEITCG